MAAIRVASICAIRTARKPAIHAASKPATDPVNRAVQLDHLSRT